ncbi:hypothetical protein BHF71_09285 [Vulcanibacillus modesticaldus]|uniref:Peptidase C39-like domain-containing protein n=1 Tax=Vulcanibacillus modesticaldus TaxID=337097 RepID=A0A1D2YU75_9BACI|nr:C39 family peptidase [Vulcanibacillus modesticaldus]OEF99262.1 hypothetical protein BHF71_09285 [Vulcanibacillus modesticaldus]
MRNALIILLIVVTLTAIFTSNEYNIIQNNFFLPDFIVNASPYLKKQTSNIRIILDVPLIAQKPELARGCEVTSLAMMLRFAGANVNKMQLAQEIKKDPTPYSQRNGRIYFGNPHTGFVGDMYTYNKPGYGVYNEPVYELANRYLPGRIINLTGKNLDYILAHLYKNKTPVWVIVNTWFTKVPDKYWVTWYTPKGKIRITYKEHSVLITGYDRKYIYFNDPLAKIKNRKVLKKNFEKAYNQMGKQAITYK